MTYPMHALDIFMDTIRQVICQDFLATSLLVSRKCKLGAYQLHKFFSHIHTSSCWTVSELTDWQNGVLHSWTMEHKSTIQCKKLIILRFNLCGSFTPESPAIAPARRCPAIAIPLARCWPRSAPKLRGSTEGPCWWALGGGGGGGGSGNTF